MGLALRLCLLLQLVVLVPQRLKLLFIFLLVSLERFLLLLEILNQISFAIGFFFELLVLSLQVLHELRVRLLAIWRKPGLLQLAELQLESLQVLLLGLDGLGLILYHLLQFCIVALLLD